jgi:hypothetical protein
MESGAGGGAVRGGEALGLKPCGVHLELIGSSGTSGLSRGSHEIFRFCLLNL